MSGRDPDDAVRIAVIAGQDKNAIESIISCGQQFMMFHDYQHPNYTHNGENLFDDTVDELMKDWKRVGHARYLVAFERT